MKRGRSRRLLLLGLCAACALLFAGLGIWQIDRLQWKLDLIARVERHQAGKPVPLPRHDAWHRAGGGRDLEYLKVRASGAFEHDRETLVEALTERGPGYWVLTPLRTSEGVVLVNRGFVPPDRRQPEQRGAGQVAGQVSVTGLLRLSEPGGRFLRANRPAAERWYSRDVTAIAARRGLGEVAPYFIDADAAPVPGGLPMGGLTVVRFRNTHLVYALTWFALAALSLWGVVLTARTSAKRS